MAWRHALLGPSIIALAAALAAQAPAVVTIQPRWKVGEVLRFRIEIHSSLTRDAPNGGQSASLDNHTVAQMKVVSADALGAVADLNVVSYKTDVSGLDLLAVQLRAAEAKLAASGPHLAPVRIRIVDGGENQVLAAPSGDEYAQIVNILKQLARTDTLPSGATAVGAEWTRQRVERLATLHFSLPTTIHCRLAGVAATPKGEIAAIAETTTAQSALPPDSIPNFAQFAQQGFAAHASLEVTGAATARYYVATGMLASAASQTHNLLRIELAGPQPKPLEITTRIDSTGAVEDLNPPSGG